MMSTQTMIVPNTTFKIGWIGLLVISGLMALNHLVLTFVMNDAVLFIGWAAFNIYSTVVLAIPFRQGQQWAWYASWVMVLAFAVMIFFDPAIGAMYLGAGILVAIGLLLTRTAFFNN